MRVPGIAPIFLVAALAALAGGRAAAQMPPDGCAAIPAGTFTMGSPESEPNRGSGEGPQHSVTLSAFYMGKYEVTQAEWVAVMGDNPSKFKGDRLPVENVCWWDCIVYCNKRSLRDGLVPCYAWGEETNPDLWAGDSGLYCDFTANGWRLPTEAEWEYACRAGTSTATAFGNSIASTQANFNGYPYNGAPKGPGLGKTAPVGSYKPNAWGLYDMHGNVHEWCWDYHGDYGSTSLVDPLGPAEGVRVVVRGGSWASAGFDIRSAYRNCEDPSDAYSASGFRVVRR